MVPLPDKIGLWDKKKKKSGEGMNVEKFKLVTVALRYLADEHNIRKKTSGLTLKAFPMDFCRTVFAF